MMSFAAMDFIPILSSDNVQDKAKQALNLNEFSLELIPDVVLACCRTALLLYFDKVNDRKN